ncbi:MAG: AtzE family amidohydrolase [Beijerinckiaceae bacterium]
MMTFDPACATAGEIARAVASGEISARAVTRLLIAHITAHNSKLRAFTKLTEERALRQAAAVDDARARGRSLGALAGVPYAVKNLFDIEGLVTLAGSKINRDDLPASSDARLVQRLDAAGAILLGALNMGEYAYDFTGENLHDGASLNPHDPRHMTGGSSGGSAAAVAAGMVPLALGSDTNGSIRVPASLCGLFGLKPTYGRLSRQGTFPFVASLDHVGPLARSVEDLALSYDAMQGPDPSDPACAQRAVEPVMPHLEQGMGGLRIAVTGDYFRRGGETQCFEAVDRVARVLGASREVTLPEARRARAAAYLITASEGAALHLERLRKRPKDFDPAVRNRLFAGAMLPASTIVQAQKFRAWFARRVADIFHDVDIMLAPSAPCRAPLSGQKMMQLDGIELPVRANRGIFTQPISFIGLPVCAVPVWSEGERLPIGVQVIGPPWREDLVLRVARHLEREGVVAAPVAKTYL